MLLCLPHTTVLMDTVGIGLSLEGKLVEEDEGERVEGEDAGGVREGEELCMVQRERENSTG